MAWNQSLNHICKKQKFRPRVKIDDKTVQFNYTKSMC